MGRNWNGSCEDWLHGDEPHGFDLPDSDDYPPMEQWESLPTVEQCGCITKRRKRLRLCPLKGYCYIYPLYWLAMAGYMRRCCSG